MTDNLLLQNLINEVKGAREDVKTVAADIGAIKLGMAAEGLPGRVLELERFRKAWEPKLWKISGGVAVIVALAVFVGRLLAR